MGTTQEKRKLHLVNRHSILMPKDRGGLAIQNLQLKNVALLASLAWRLFQNPTWLWASTLIHKYKHSSSKSSSSHTWRNVLLGWQHCQNGLKWQLGSNSALNFWYDSWLSPNTPLRSLLTGPLPQNHIIQSVNYYRDLHNWNLTQLPFHLNKDLKALIHRVHMPIYTHNTDKIS